MGELLLDSLEGWLRDQEGGQQRVLLVPQRPFPPKRRGLRCVGGPSGVGRTN